MPTRYVLGRERGGSMTMKPTATRTWLACPGSTRGEEGVPFGEQAPRPTWYRLCVQPQLHTLGSATPLPQTFQNPLQRSVTTCARAVCTCFLRPSLTSGEDEASSLQLLAGGQVWGHRAAQAVPVFFLLPKEYEWLSLARAWLGACKPPGPPDLLLKRTAMFFTNFSLKVDFGCSAILYMPQLQYQPRKGGGGERPLPQQLGLQDRGTLSFPAGWNQELYTQYHPSSQAYHTCIKLLIRSISRLFQHYHGRVPHAHTPAGRATPYSLSRGEAASSAWVVSQHLAAKLGGALQKVGEMLRTGSPLHAAPQGTDGLSPCNKWVMALFALSS